MSLNQLQDFYKKTISVDCGAGAGNIYVSTKPTVSNGYLVISPTNTALREIIRYTGTGTDTTGDYVTVASVADRGLGGTTAQTHKSGESIRMNITSLHWADLITEMLGKLDTSVDFPNTAALKAYIDGISIAGGSVASQTVLGLNRMSASPDVSLGTCTITIASPAVITLNSHGLTAGDIVKFSTTGALPTGITAGTSYYVMATGLTANAFQISATATGSAINTSGSQSGVHTLTKATPVAVANTDTKMLTQAENDAVAGKSGAGVSATNLLMDEAYSTDGTTLDQSQTTQNGSVSVGEADATTKYNKMAQSFIAGKTPLSSVKLHKLADTGTFTGSVTISIQADSSGSPSGTPLATVTISNGTWLALSTGLFTASFGTPYVPQLGSTYWLVIETSTSDNSNKINLGTNTAGGYASGSVKFKNTTDSWVAIATIDLTFYLYTNLKNKVIRFDTNEKYPQADGSNISNLSLKGSFVFGEDIASGVPVFIGHGKSEKRIIAGNHLQSTQTTIPTSSTNRIGQTFKSKTGRISGFRFFISSSASRTFTYAIYATSGGLPTGAALATGNTGAVYKETIEVTLGTPLTITPDAVYAIAIYADGASTSWLRWSASSVKNTYESTDYIDAYPDGQNIVESAGTWSVSSTTDDYCFEIIDERTYTENYVWISSGLAFSPVSTLTSNQYNSGQRNQTNKVFGWTAETQTAGNTGSVQYQGVVTPANFPTMQTSVSEYVEQQQTNNGNILFQTDSTNKWAVQTFQTGEIDVITAIELYIGKTGTPGDVLSVYLCEVDEDTGKVQADNSGTGLPNNYLGVVTYSNADVTSTNWFKKTFSTPIKVRPRTKYAFVMRYGTYAPTNYFNVYGDTTTSYIGAQQYTSSSSTMNVFTSTPYAFKIYTTTHRYGYQGDYVYLGKSCGYLSFKNPVRDLMTKVGEIYSSTQLVINDQFKNQLIKKYSYSGTNTVSNTWYIPIERNARRLVIRQSTVQYEIMLDEFTRNIGTYKADAGTVVGTSSISQYGHTMVGINFNTNETSGTTMESYQYN